MDLLGHRFLIPQALQPQRSARAPAGRIQDQIAGDELLRAGAATTFAAVLARAAALAVRLEPHPDDAAPVGEATRSVTSCPSTKVTPGSARTRARTWPSSSGRPANNTDCPIEVRLMRCPDRNHRTLPNRSPTEAPAAMTSSVSPGSRPSSARPPRASSTCTCRPCGTPRRCSASVGSTSRSTTVTRSNDSVNARAASSPAMLAPSTTACFPMAPAIASPPKSDGWTGSGASRPIVRRESSAAFFEPAASLLRPASVGNQGSVREPAGSQPRDHCP